MLARGNENFRALPRAQFLLIPRRKYSLEYMCAAHYVSSSLINITFLCFRMFQNFNYFNHFYCGSIFQGMEQHTYVTVNEPIRGHARFNLTLQAIYRYLLISLLPVQLLERRRLHKWRKELTSSSLGRSNIFVLPLFISCPEKSNGAYPRRCTVQSTPNMNQAENHSRQPLVKRDRMNMPLLDAAHADVRDNVQLEVEYKAFSGNSNGGNGGNGPSLKQRQNEATRSQLKRAKGLGEDLIREDVRDQDRACDLINPMASPSLYFRTTQVSSRGRLTRPKRQSLQADRKQPTIFSEATKGKARERDN